MRAKISDLMNCKGHLLICYKFPQDHSLNNHSLVSCFEIHTCTHTCIHEYTQKLRRQEAVSVTKILNTFTGKLQSVKNMGER